MSDMSLRPILPGDEMEVLRVFKSSPSYFLRVDGCEPSLHTVQISMNDKPKKLSLMYRKEFLFLEYNDKAIGVSDLHIHHPEAGFAYLGQMLLSEEYFGRKFGTRFYAMIEHHLKTNFNIKVVRLGVSDDNDVSAFWRKQGFAPNSKTYTWEGENKTTQVIEFEKGFA